MKFTLVESFLTETLPTSYSKTVNNSLKGIGAIDVYASLYAGSIVYY